MKNVKKMMSRFFVFGLLLGAVGLTATFNARGMEEVKALEPEKITPYRLSPSDFDDEIEISSESLDVSITQSAVTDTSQSISILFRSTTGIGFKTARGNYVVVIDDENFTGKVDEPAIEGYDVVDEETGLPLFHGCIYQVLGGGGRNSDVYLPSTMTRAGSFVIKIDTILAHCVVPSPAAGQEEINNAWFTPYGVQKIKNIYIPDTITNVEREAFLGVPTEGVTIHYEGSELPDDFVEHWTDAPASAIDISVDSYSQVAQKKANTAGSTVPIGVADDFFLGTTRGTKKPEYDNDDYNVPLTIEFDKVKEDGTRETVFDELPLINTVNNNYDAVGDVAASTYSRLLGYRLEAGESIDDDSIRIHNITKYYTEEDQQADPTHKMTLINPYRRFFCKPRIAYREKQSLANIVSFKASKNSTFMGFSRFSLTMDKNLSITSEKYPQPHSLYLDVMTEQYEQNLINIKAGKTVIRYSLYNLYNSSYHFKYIGSNGQMKEFFLPISSVISYQTLDKDTNNLVSILVQDRDIPNQLKKAGVENYQDYNDFSADKVCLFELKDITIQMDLFATSDSGSTSKLGKSEISYKFAYITVINQETPIKVFNWNIFLVVFVLGFIALYSAGAVGVYFFMKERFKNDEFRRVNGKKYVKKAIIGGLGATVVATAILLIVMRLTGFKNTIVSFNPTDPLLIGFSIVALIVTGYFIVMLVKLIKVENERRKIIKLKLNEDIDDDGTN